MLESEEAARRLGVKITTLYAYVSRGLLSSHPAEGSRRSLFDLEEVERLAKRQRAGRRVETRLASITTGVTQIRDDGPAYRGIPVDTLAATHSFEEVAELLWKADPDPAGWISNDLPDISRLVQGPKDVLRLGLLLSGISDPLRSDLRPEAVTRDARRLISTCVHLLGGGSTPPASIAQRLAFALLGEESYELAEILDTALVVLADHELATSTLGVRLAASTRADLYDALTAGLCVLAGPLHGGASELAHGLLVLAEEQGAGPALDATLRWQRRVHGFGHTIYLGSDPRFDVLMKKLEQVMGSQKTDLVYELLDIAEAHSIPGANIDLAVAAVTWSWGLPATTGQTIFSIARLVGWTAHYLEELNERGLRFRARAVYSLGG